MWPKPKTITIEEIRKVIDLMNQRKQFLKDIKEFYTSNRIVPIIKRTNETKT